MNHNKENQSGYNEAPKFGPSDSNPPMSMFDKKWDCDGPEFIKPDKKWEGVIKLGEIDGVSLFYDSLHPEHTLTVDWDDIKGEMNYIIGPYDDIAIYDGIKKTIRVDETPSNMIKSKNK